MPKNSKQVCPDCLPVIRYNHNDLWVKFWIEPFFLNYFKFIRLIIPFRRQVLNLVLEILRLVKIVRFENKIEKFNLDNRSLIFWNEAQILNLRIALITFLGQSTELFQVQINDQIFLFEQVPLVSSFPKINFDSKLIFKNFLNKNKISTPPHEIFWFWQSQKALKYAETLGFPLVVKPVNGSLSQHVSIVKNLAELPKAIKIAQKYEPLFMVEKFAKGSLIRVNVIAQKHVFVCQRIATNVVGNGQNSILELIKIKNTERNLANFQTNFQNNYQKSNLSKLTEITKKPENLQSKNCQKISKNNLEPENKESLTKISKIILKPTLRQIKIDEELTNFLATQNLNLESILKNGDDTCLNSKITLSRGCDILELTDKAHPEIKAYFLKISQLLSANLVGFDLLCDDVSLPILEQNFAILEANSCPYLNMHEHPSSGFAQKVAQTVWQEILKNPKLLENY